MSGRRQLFKAKARSSFTFLQSPGTYPVLSRNIQSEEIHNQQNWKGAGVFIVMWFHLLSTRGRLAEYGDMAVNTMGLVLLGTRGWKLGVPNHILWYTGCLHNNRPTRRSRLPVVLLLRNNNNVVQAIRMKLISPTLWALSGHGYVSLKPRVGSCLLKSYHRLYNSRSREGGGGFVQPRLIIWKVTSGDSFVSPHLRHVIYKLL